MFNKEYRIFVIIVAIFVFVCIIYDIHTLAFFQGLSTGTNHLMKLQREDTKLDYIYMKNETSSEKSLRFNFRINHKQVFVAENMHYRVPPDTTILLLDSRLDIVFEDDDRLYTIQYKEFENMVVMHVFYMGDDFERYLTIRIVATFAALVVSVGMLCYLSVILYEEYKSRTRIIPK